MENGLVQPTLHHGLEAKRICKTGPEELDDAAQISGMKNTPSVEAWLERATGMAVSAALDTTRPENALPANA